jgi:hypothetical protein
MVSPAHIDDQKQYLVLAEEDTTPNRTLSAGESVATGLSENELFDNVSAFYYNDRVRITFLASEKFKPDFSLIRGLLEFNRPRNLMFTYDRHATSVSIDLAKDHLTNLDVLLTNVRNWLVKEKLFRKALRTVIEFEKHYQQERDRIYNILNNTTVAAATV